MFRAKSGSGAAPRSAPGPDHEGTPSPTLGTGGAAARAAAMARTARVVAAGMPQHVVERGHPRRCALRDDPEACCFLAPAGALRLQRNPSELRASCRPEAAGAVPGAALRAARRAGVEDWRRQDPLWVVEGRHRGQRSWWWMRTRRCRHSARGLCPVWRVVVGSTGLLKWRAMRCSWPLGWRVVGPQPGTYALTMRCAAPAGPVELVANLEGRSVMARVPRTSGGRVTLNLGTWRLRRTGARLVRVRCSPTPPLQVESLDRVPCAVP